MLSHGVSWMDNCFLNKGTTNGTLTNQLLCTSLQQLTEHKNGHVFFLQICNVWSEINNFQILTNEIWLLVIFLHMDKMAEKLGQQQNTN